VKDLLADLEKEASSLLDDKMNSFVKKDNSKVIACPWLNWRKDCPEATPGKIQGIFIMQDWGELLRGLRKRCRLYRKTRFSLQWRMERSN